jgi:hypothetical protein
LLGTALSLLQHLAKLTDSFALKAEENSDLTLIAKSNAMRKSANDKSAELPKLKQLISDKQLELQNCKVNADSYIHI